MAARQLSLGLKRERVEHGGEVRQGLRKEARPFRPRALIHVVMRSGRARGKWSLLHRRNRAHVERLLYKWASAKGVRIYRFANVGNHVHLLLRASDQKGFQQFLKTFSGLVARAITGAQRGVRSGKFWDRTAYSRLIPSGAYRAIRAYLEKNRLEAIGFRGAELRFRKDGSAVVVAGEPESPAQRAEVERLIRAGPGVNEVAVTLA